MDVYAYQSKKRTKMAVAEDVSGNPDLLEEILIRLPLKCLTRSKLVSKRWCSLISSPRFARRKPSSPTGMFISNPYENDNFVSFDSSDPFQTTPSLSFLGKMFAGGDSQTSVLQSCNGLLLCRVTAGLNQYCFCVCNPTTKQYRVIPRGNVSGYITLAYDPRTCPHYKVLLIRSRRIDVTYKYDVYSSEDHRWKHQSSSVVPLGNPVVINGAIYWVDLDQGYCTCFDINTEEMTRIPMPPKPKQSDINCLAECGGYLRCSADSWGTDSNFYIFEMSRDFSEWVTKYVVNVCPIVEAFPEVAYVLPECDRKFYGVSALCVVEGGKGEGEILVLALPGKIVSYNLKHNTVKKLSEPFGYNCVNAFPFIESLSLV